ncbi:MULTISPECIES: LysR family transcriptional regulator [Ralstonia solanacearum species complex]|uniref:LysR family transcriptional regulator n=1 Tax=Ralstonia syzygii TaxID=28097 RepID=A0ABX7ZDW4_9RALS|nr:MULTISPECIES: LysR family transcriptional regulator [Ralstonia solanacearum species complex]BEU71793.1 LysR family transcriptional regulator [Ralstonia pseudosolanacearum]AMP37316.1 LysR family transcriptional regulator [Ralstonia solanacearum]AXV76727.1 LysR family transcriptional regulator [Ralstonia solanacearum]AXV86138.1 LysR family transcriptional regulator [Ralstonia solanacearum]AXV90737.1 LysR family transcriptional regulator [Ralstonia solanacearum]
MELRQLEAFAAVMSTGSVTAAGKLLGRSQPAISRLIQDLEAEIGYALFTRSGPRVSPTEQGFLLYEDVEHTLISLRQIRTRAEEIARGEARPLRLAATSALAAGLLPAALADDAELSRHIQIRSASPEQVVHAVLTGAADLGLSSLPLEHRGVTVHWIGEAACVAALRTGDPLAAGDRVALADCGGRRIVTMHNPYRLRRRLDQALAQAGVTLSELIETNASLNALTAVRAGLGVALLEPVTAYGVPIEGVTVRPIDVPIPFFFGVITPEARRPSPAVTSLIDALSRAAQRLLPDCKLHDPARHASMLQVLYGEPLNETEGASA